MTNPMNKDEKVEQLKKEAKKELEIGLLPRDGGLTQLEMIEKYIDKAAQATREAVEKENEQMGTASYMKGFEDGRKATRERDIAVIEEGFGPQGYDGAFYYAGDGGPFLKEEIIKVIRNLE